MNSFSRRDASLSLFLIGGVEVGIGKKASDEVRVSLSLGDHVQLHVAFSLDDDGGFTVIIAGDGGSPNLINPSPSPSSNSSPSHSSSPGTDDAFGGYCARGGGGGDGGSSGGGGSGEGEVVEGGAHLIGGEENFVGMSAHSAADGG